MILTLSNTNQDSLTVTVNGGTSVVFQQQASSINLQDQALSALEFSEVDQSSIIIFV